jgi:ubiquinone/menaquinone biosynthesis C-methylase UbiE
MTRMTHSTGMTADAAYWDAQADTFDDEPDHGLRAPATRQAWTELLGRYLPPPPSLVADLGCGSGTLSVLLAQAGHHVIGVDYAPRMLEAARRKATAASVRARFVVGDASAPPLPPERFDVVLSRHVLWAMPDPSAALTSWIRLLVPGGRLVLVEGRWHTGSGLTAEEAIALVSAAREEVQIEHLTDPVLWGGPRHDERYLIVSRR